MKDYSQMIISGWKKRVSHGADANTCFLHLQYHRSRFALKTAFTFTFNRAAKMQCSFATDVDIRISLRNGLDFQYKMSFSLRHSPNWQIISLLALKHLHYALLGPEKACLSISFFAPHVLPLKWPSEQISPSPFLLLSARRC